jgi:hypothetical protein
MARQYLTEQKEGYGLGVGVRGSGDTLSFSHGGRDEGFDAMLLAFAATGQGAAIMINANDNSRFMGRILDFIGRTHGWPRAGQPPTPPAAVTPAPIEPARLARYAGYYEFRENQMVTLVPNASGTGLETLTDGLPDEGFLALDSARFGSTERGVRIAFTLDSSGAVTGVVWAVGQGPPRERTVARVAPLPASQTPVSDPDSGLTRRIVAALLAIREGGSALSAAPDIPPGTKQDFAGGVGTALDGLAALDYVGTEDVSRRSIHRHGSDVARVRYYRVTTSVGQRSLLVHLTADESIADYDVVQR